MIRVWRCFAKWIADHLLGLLVGSICLGMVGTVLWPYSVIEIPPGQRMT